MDPKEHEPIVCNETQAYDITSSVAIPVLCDTMCWSNIGVCHISLSSHQILIKFTALVYCMNIFQSEKCDLICIMVAMVTDESLLSVNGFSIKHIPINLLALL